MARLIYFEYRTNQPTPSPNRCNKTYQLSISLSPSPSRFNAHQKIQKSITTSLEQFFSFLRGEQERREREKETSGGGRISIGWFRGKKPRQGRNFREGLSDGGEKYTPPAGSILNLAEREGGRFIGEPLLRETDTRIRILELRVSRPGNTYIKWLLFARHRGGRAKQNA